MLMIIYILKTQQQQQQQKQHEVVVKKLLNEDTALLFLRRACRPLSRLEIYSEGVSHYLPELQAFAMHRVKCTLIKTVLFGF
jgi:hypothetical protein